jgi:hypothetical protein
MDSLPRVFGDPLRLDIGEPDPRLKNESNRHIALCALGCLQELAARVRNYCEDADQTSENKRAACQLLVNVGADAALYIHLLVQEFPSSFREIAERSGKFPCLFPAHRDEIKALEKIMLDDLALGTLHPLKLRAVRGLKTFSMETYVNQILLHYIRKIRGITTALLSNRLAGLRDFESSPMIEIERIQHEVPLTADTAKQWLAVIWELLLLDVPHPEKHRHLSQLGQRKSRKEKGSNSVGKVGAKTQATNVRASIKEALGRQLKRLLGNRKPSTFDK